MSRRRVASPAWVRRGRGEWMYSHSADLMKVYRLFIMVKCIAKWRPNLDKTIKGRKVLEECRGTENKARISTPSVLVGENL